MMPHWPTRSAWACYGRWALLVTLAFLAVYPGCNWLSAQRAGPADAWFAAELQIPFVPGFVWAYLSMYLLFLAPPFWLAEACLPALGRALLAGTAVSGLIFLFFPTRLGFVRSLPASEPYASIFAGIFTADLPHNMLPSLHVVFSALILLALSDAHEGLRKLPWLVWLALICASTVLVHQHHLADIVAGLVIAAVCHRRPAPERK